MEVNMMSKIIAVLQDAVVKNWLTTVAGLTASAAMELYGKLANDTDPKIHILAISFFVIGIVAKSFYVTSTTVPSKPEGGFMKTKLLLVLAAASTLALALPTKAAPLVTCLSGCSQTLKAPRPLGATDVQLNAVLWAGPSIGLTPLVYDTSTKTWEKAIAPTFSYGLKYRPANWTATASLVALDLGLRADFSDFSKIDVLPQLTFLDAVTVGVGPRFRFASGSQAGGTTLLFAIGFTTSLGTP
jgi:hypothetical protein